jgi:hypothetical protein
MRRDAHGGVAKDFLCCTAKYQPTNVELLTPSTSSDCWLTQISITESNEQIVVARFAILDFHQDSEWRTPTIGQHGTVHACLSRPIASVNFLNATY